MTRGGTNSTLATLAHRDTSTGTVTTTLVPSEQAPKVFRRDEAFSEQRGYYQPTCDENTPVPQVPLYHHDSIKRAANYIELRLSEALSSWQGLTVFFFSPGTQ